MSKREEFEPAITETEAFLHSDGTWDGEQCHGTSGHLGVPFIRADLAAEREIEIQMTVYSALEMLKEGNGMRAMAILSNRVDEIEGALATHNNEGES